MTPSNERPSLPHSRPPRTLVALLGPYLYVPARVFGVPKEGVAVRGMEDLPEAVFLQGGDPPTVQALQADLPDLSRPEVQAYIVRYGPDTFSTAGSDQNHVWTEPGRTSRPRLGKRSTIHQTYSTVVKPPLFLCRIPRFVS